MITYPPEIRDAIHKRLVHEVHTSERRSYRGCRRRWHWVFQEFYYPQVTAKPLEFGVAFHAAMEVIYNPDTWTFDRKIVKNLAKVKFNTVCEEQKVAYLRANGQNYLTNAEVEQDYEERVALGLGMLDYYMDEVAPTYDAHLRPKSVEIEFVVPIQNPDTDEFLFCTCFRCRKTQQEAWAQDPELADIDMQLINMHGANGLNWVISMNGQGHIPWSGLVVCLAGRLDMLGEDDDGHYWIVDWKTAARLARGDISGQDRDEFLELDDQIGSYVMALRRKLGLDVRGFIYVELKKSVPAPPERNKTIRLGRYYSVNKAKATDYELYLKTVMEGDPAAYDAGLYDDHLKWLKEEGQNFHARYQIVKLDEELEEIERNLFMEAKEMTTPGLPIYYSAGRFACGFCAFRQPCIEKNRQGDFQYMLDTLYEKRDKHYWVKELSTDTEGGE